MRGMALVLGEGVQEFLQSFKVVCGEFYGTLYSVQQPTQNYFAGCQATSPLVSFLVELGSFRQGE